MKQPVWSSVRKDLRMQPLTEGRIGGDAPLYVERWVYQARKVDVSGIKCPVLITQAGEDHVDDPVGLVHELQFARRLEHHAQACLPSIFRLAAVTSRMVRLPSTLRSRLRRS